MGISMANAEQTAQGLASLGRYGDSMMVHMNPNEVSGLQQLAEANGSTLTINPDTGMPEAFLGDFINSLLPTAAGIAGGAVGGPAGAAAAGALTGYAQGKRDPLELAMAGLSGYGGGQIGSALGAGGTQALAGTAEAASGVAAGTAEAAAAQTFNAPVSNVIGANQMAGVSNLSNIPTAQINQANNLQHLSNKNLTVPSKGQPTPFSQAGGQGFSPQGTPDVLGESITQVNEIGFNATPNTNNLQSFNPGLTNDPTKLNNTYGLDTTLRETSGSLAKLPEAPNFNDPLKRGLDLGREIGNPVTTNGIDSLKASGRGIKDAFNNPTDFLERLGGGEYTDSAGNIINKGGEGSALYGGIKLGAPIAMAGVDAAYADAYDTVDPITRGGPSGPLNLSDAFRPSMTLPMYAQGGMIPSYQAGGIAGLGYGGLLEGTGDGISDSIPARIDGSQEAALSKGEFVVPARIVSEIGNGSSDAGAERLYAMMDRVEKDRERTTGQGNIAVDTNAERRLPA
jgi:hypothetical protein